MNYICLDIETTGLLPWYGNHITCICAKTEDGEEFGKVGKNEIEIITEFYSFLTHPTNDYYLLTKNGMSFDIPFILARAAQLFVPEDFNDIMQVLLSYKHFDMHYATKTWVKLDSMAELYGIRREPKDNPIILFKNNQLSDLLAICKEDVKITIETFNKFIELNPNKAPKF